MSTPVELQPGCRLHDLLVLAPEGPGMAEIRRIAALRVGGVDAREAKVLGRRVADWSVQALAGDIESAFDIDPFSLMAQAWVQLRQVRQTIRDSQGPPAAEKGCGIGRHKLAATIEPRLVLEVQGVDWCDVTLTVELALSFDTVQLVFESGALKEARFGRPTGSVSLKCAGQEVAATKRQVDLQASCRFDPPLAMPAIGTGDH